MLVVCSNKAVKAKYPGQDGDDVLAAVAALGPTLDVSDLDGSQIRVLVDQQDPARHRPVCLVGGYDLVPTFRLPNPTRHAAKETDSEVPTDAPYGARADSEGETFLPTRPVARIPDSGIADVAGFISLLRLAAQAPAIATPAGDFHQAAAEFAGSAALVQAALANASPVRLSPPDPTGMSSLPQLLTGCGRVHILLHGSDKAPGRSTLWGHAVNGAEFLPAARATDIALCGLQGAIVSFSSCYSAMLDAVSGDAARTPDDQVALASLRAGAKVVFGCTRANWIDITQPFNSFGSALVAHVWKELQLGRPAAEALRLAKWAYARFALQVDPWTRPYVLKTLLQAQCYGHPMATL